MSTEVLATWPHAQDSPALLLARRGGRLSDRAARTIITDLGEHVGLGADTSGGIGFGPHALRHTFVTQLLRGGADPAPATEIADVLGTLAQAPPVVAESPPLTGLRGCYSHSGAGGCGVGHCTRAGAVLSSSLLLPSSR